MSRKEIVVLVSRAIACIQLISALLDICYLPEKLLSLMHYASMQELPGTNQRYYRVLDTVSISTLLVRIAILLVTFLIFWNCGPWIERTLLPAEEKPGQPHP